MSASKAKGTRWESAIVAYLDGAGLPVERRTLADLAQIAIELGRRADMQAAARIAAERRMGPAGRHRAPSLVARLRQRIGGR